MIAAADNATIIVQILGGAGLIAGGYFILKDVVDYKLKISDRVEARLERVESHLEKCEAKCERLMGVLRDHRIFIDDPDKEDR